MTIVVVAIVLAGPSLIACSQSPDGLAACLRQRVVEAGLLPADQPAVVVASPQVEPGVQAPAAPPAAAEAEATLAVATAPAPTLLRAEPDGSLVIAGTGGPGAKIEVFANGEPLGATTAEPSGDWVVVPETRLEPGGVEITIGEAGSEARAEQSFVVVVDPGRRAEPLVVATKPGEASAVLQGLPLAPEPEEVAAAPESQATAPEPAPRVKVVAPDAAPSRSAAKEPAPTQPAAVDEPQPAASVADVAPEAIEPAPQPTPVPVVITPPSIDAIEIDGEANFFAGGGSEGATIRLYVNDRFVADSEVVGGRWLVEATDVLAQPSQRVRIDVLKPGTAEVAARAEVNFEIDLPAAESEPRVAEDQPEAEVAPPAVEDEPVALPTPVVEAGPQAGPAPPAVAPAEPEAAPRPELTAVAEPSDGAPDPAAAPAPDSTVVATSEAVPAAGAQKDLLVAAQVQPKGPADRDLAGAEKPPADVVTVPNLAQPAKEPGQPDEKGIDTADVPDAAATTPKPLAPSRKPAAMEPKGTAMEPKPTVVEPKPAPAATPAPSEPPPVPQVATMPEPEPAEESAATPALPPAPEQEAKPATPPTTIASVPPGEDEIPTLKAVPIGDPESMRFASGKAIIRRGDNLWSIARRVYGTGLKYTTIYRANKDQIRSPSRIYPGQVFDLPLVSDE